MAKQELNRVQDYFNTIFAHDLTEKNFEELKQVVRGWLGKKLMESTPENFNHINDNKDGADKAK